MDKNPKYFEGTLQLRNPTQEIIDFVANEIDKREDVWIAKTVKQKNGVDLDLSSNKFLKEIGKRLANRFPGVLKHSSSLFTRKRLTQKEVHRGTILFRYVDIKKGDIIKYRGEEVIVVSWSKDVLAKDSKNNKIHIKFEDLQ